MGQTSSTIRQRPHRRIRKTPTGGGGGQVSGTDQVSGTEGPVRGWFQPWSRGGPGRCR
ncbi:hypothetical protein Save01_07138 [Streptomyces avermitilis]|uniref:Uncharacterized protein n=1 Tax=Streptomyces avermitilis TaxID=33903 RepID=A0A4D4MZU1_STRAX|nr:hypothetical protein SAV31267_072370 [Streptomyces avermitilis]GDY86629.1 hypothetical protein SAVCW2_58280 [Streptomyces avermitilis]